MGYPGKVKFPIISNHFAKCGHKGELLAVFSAIYYLKGKNGSTVQGGTVFQNGSRVELFCSTFFLSVFKC